MQFEDIRPVLSGIVGGLVAMGLYRLWAKWLPKGSNGKPTEALRLQYRAERRVPMISQTGADGPFPDTGHGEPRPQVAPPARHSNGFSPFGTGAASSGTFAVSEAWRSMCVFFPG